MVRITSVGNAIFTHLVPALEKSTSSDEDRAETNDENAQTIRPVSTPGAKPAPLAQAPALKMQPIVEDWSDIASEEDEDWLQEKVLDFKVGLPLHGAVIQNLSVPRS